MSHTTTTAAPATPAVTHPRDLRRLGRWAAAISIVLGPLLVTVLRAILPYWTSDEPATAIDSIAASPGRIAAVNWLSVVSYPFLVFGAVSVAYAVRRRVPVLAWVGGGVLFTGLTVASMVGASDLLAEVMTREGYDRALTLQLTTQFMEHPAGLFGLLGFVLGHIVGMVLLGIAVARSRLVPWWVGAAIVVAQPVHVVAAVIAPSRALDVIGGWGLTTAGFAFVALSVLRMSDDEWDLPPTGVR